MYKKIDIFCGGKYICSTAQAKNLQEARENFFKNPTWAGLLFDGSVGVVKLHDWKKENEWDSRITFQYSE